MRSLTHKLESTHLLMRVTETLEELRHKMCLLFLECLYCMLIAVKRQPKVPI
jgi:hypothetical protein